MQRRYLPLQPSIDTSASSGQSAPSSSSKPEVGPLKRRRVGVTVACNSCRKRKVRCDGHRPQCFNCQTQAGGKCEYRDEEALSRESKDVVTEIVTTLNQLPTTSLVQTLRAMKKGDSATTALAILRDSTGADCELKTPAESSDSTPLPGGNTTQDNTDGEIETQYPTVYKSLGEPLPRLLLKEPYAGLADSSKRSHAAVSPLCDPRLEELEIQQWTSVGMPSDLAARCISLYLETDHPLLCHFDSDLFVASLTSGQRDHCSPLLVNALLYWACQMYCAVEPQSDEFAVLFCEEASRLWEAERRHQRDSAMTMSATVFLCLGHLGQGRDDSVLKYLAEVTQMGTRLGLFGIKAGGTAKGARSTDVYEAWGVFNWTVLMSLFYHQPGIVIPVAAPRVPMPQTTPVSPYMGCTFPYLCKFWSILHEVGTLYYAGGVLPWGDSSSVYFAEFKYRELLAWSNSLPYKLISEQGNPHHVEIMHIWFHAAVLDLLRPLIHDDFQKHQRLRTFTSEHYTPQVIYEKSTAQLKRLIIDYRLNYTSSSFTFLWHTALIYVANAVLDSETDQSWYFYMMFCLYGYENLSRSWRVGKAISKALLSAMMQKGRITSHAARELLQKVQTQGAEIPEEIRATFMGDLRLALSQPGSATVEHLAGAFEENAAIHDYTNIFDIFDHGPDVDEPN